MHESTARPGDETRTRVHIDALTPWPAQAMLGLLDRDPRAIAEGDPLPLGWHWLYFKRPCRSSRLARDGHEVRGDFMPDVDLSRRMWAGGTLRSLRPALLGEPAELRSEIVSVTEKRGKSGRLVFVIAGHTVLQKNRRCVEEEQVIVYRESVRGLAVSPSRTTAPPSGELPGNPGQGPGSGGADSSAPEWTETFPPTTVNLFQFSALTYNSHRIHYDHSYATQQEGYPGLLVHGPLTALLLLDAAQRHAPAPVSSFRYRALTPLFVDQPITLVGQAAPAPTDGSDPPRERIVEALAPSGTVAMRARVT